MAQQQAPETTHGAVRQVVNDNATDSETRLDSLETGKVAGPASSNDNAIARFNGTGGKTVQNSDVIIADTTNNISGLGTINGAGNITMVQSSGTQRWNFASGAGDRFGYLEKIQSTSGNMVLFNKGTGQLQIVQDSGGVYLAETDTAWNSISDERLKENISVIPDCLTKIDSISGKYYSLKSEKKAEADRVGVIAQEVKKVLPEAVTEDDNGTLGVKYTELIPLLIGCIKELKAEVAELKK